MWRSGLLLGSLLLALLLVAQRPVLEIHDEDGALLYRQALDPGEPLTLSYRHSVNGQPVREVYVLDANGGLRVVEHAYRTQGAGLGQVEGEGRRLEAPEGWTRVVGLDRPVGRFALRVGQPAVDHRVAARGTEWRLSRSLAGRRVWVGGRPAPLVVWLLQRRSAVPQPPPWEETR